MLKSERCIFFCYFLSLCLSSTPPVFWVEISALWHTVQAHWVGSSCGRERFWFLQLHNYLCVCAKGTHTQVESSRQGGQVFTFDLYRGLTVEYTTTDANMTSSIHCILLPPTCLLSSFSLFQSMSDPRASPLLTSAIKDFTNNNDTVQGKLWSEE